MSICNGCGAKITWIVMHTGSKMICDGPIKHLDKRTRVIRSDGHSVEIEAGPILDTGLKYYTPHWATCPKANNYRKKK